MNIPTQTFQSSSCWETEHKSDRVDETHADVARQSTATAGDLDTGKLAANSMPERQTGAARRKGRPGAAQGHRRASKRSKARRKERGLTFQRCWSNVRIGTMRRRTKARSTESVSGT
jgi:hypothetical protein